MNEKKEDKKTQKFSVNLDYKECKSDEVPTPPDEAKTTNEEQSNRISETSEIKVKKISNAKHLEEIDNVLTEPVKKRRKKRKLLIAISIIVILLGAGGGYIFWRLTPATWTGERVEISLPFQEINKINFIEAYGDLGYQYHNGIDFGINATIEIVAWCKLRVIMVDTWFNDDAGAWQTNVRLKYSWKYSFDCIFESLAQNESYGKYQRDAIDVKVGQVLEEGDFIGLLLDHSIDARLHFGIMENGKDVCPYQFFGEDARAIFDYLFLLVGSHPDECN